MFGNSMPKLKFYPDKREKVKWKCPGLFEHDKAILLLHDLCMELKIKQPVHAVFGGITSPWNGGRMPQIDTITEKELCSIIEEYNKRNIACHFTFSNYRVEKQHLNDDMGNLVCKVLSNIDFPNHLIISSDLLSDYVRQKYPNIKQTASVIKPMYEVPEYDETPQYYNNLCERFDCVCIRPEWNTNRKFLKQLRYKDKIELMVNNTCFKRCPLSQIHYDNIVKYTKNDIEAEKKLQLCNEKSNDINTIYENLFNSSEQIDEMVKLGFYNLKLRGRCCEIRTFLRTIIGRYIFEPTGYFQVIEGYIFGKLGGM